MKDNSENITIENKVLRAINNCESEVTIPSEVIKIGKGAFKGSSITAVVFEGNNLKSIEDEAFRDCTSLSNIMIPEGVIQIGDNAFSGCSSLDYIGIPESVVVVGDNILDNCKNDLFVIGKEGSEAANIANQYKLTLRSDSAQAIAAFKQARDEKTKNETREFVIFGETISCSNTLSKYHDTLEYYSSRKEPIFKEFSGKLPQTLSERFGDLLATLKKEQNTLISRLSSQGVFITENALAIYITEPYKAIAEAVKAIRDVYDTVNKDLSEGISNNREALINEAESKVTGLSYGIIGGGVDMLAYSIDDFMERQRQRQQAYAEAEKKAAEFRKQHTSQGNQIYSDFISKVFPFLNQGTDLFIDALCKAEIDFLINAGLIDATFINTIDPVKSSHIMKSIADKQGDNTFAVALALKKYPCNIAALVYAKEHGYTCQGLIELVSFLGIEDKLVSGVKASKTNRVNSIINSIKESSDGNAGVTIMMKEENFLDEESIKKCLSYLAPIISSQVEELIKPTDMVNNIIQYCTAKLNKIITFDNWQYFIKYDILPIESDSIIIHTKDYEDLKKWICEQTKEYCERSEKKYKEAKELCSKATNIPKMREVARLFENLGNYKDSANEYSALQERIKQIDIKIRKNSIKILISSIAIELIGGLIYGPIVRQGFRMLFLAIVSVIVSSIPFKSEYRALQERIKQIESNKRGNSLIFLIVYIVVIIISSIIVFYYTRYKLQFVISPRYVIPFTIALIIISSIPSMYLILHRRRTS